MRPVTHNEDGRVVAGRRSLISYGAAKRSELRRRATQMAQDEAIQRPSHGTARILSAGLVQIRAREIARALGV